MVMSSFRAQRWGVTNLRDGNNDPGDCDLFGHRECEQRSVWVYRPGGARGPTYYPFVSNHLSKTSAG